MIEVGAEADAIISVVVPVSATVFALMMAAGPTTYLLYAFQAQSKSGTMRTELLPSRGRDNPIRSSR